MVYAPSVWFVWHRNIGLETDEHHGRDSQPRQETGLATMKRIFDAINLLDSGVNMRSSELKASDAKDL